jgi:hypothetical protein
MKATVKNLWSTDREIITVDDSEFNSISSFSELKKCDNVLIGDRIESTGPREVIIDNNYYLVLDNKVRHPSGFSMKILEIL